MEEKKGIDQFIKKEEKTKEEDEQKEELKEQTTEEESLKEVEDKVLKETNKLIEQMREENKARLEILKREESLVAKKLALAELGGDSMAGNQIKKREETPREYAQRILKGELREGELK